MYLVALENYKPIRIDGTFVETDEGVVTILDEEENILFASTWFRVEYIAKVDKCKLDVEDGALFHCSEEQKEILERMSRDV